jgi:hypothetical protein
MEIHAKATMIASIAGFIFVVLVLGVGITLDHYYPHAAMPAYSCTAAAGEQCFSDSFDADFERFKSLRGQVLAMQKDPDTKALAMAEKSDQLNGMAMRLNNEIPKGYVVDEKKMRFVSVAPTTAANAPSPSTTPQPAPPPVRR